MDKRNDNASHGGEIGITNTGTLNEYDKVLSVHFKPNLITVIIDGSNLFVTTQIRR